MRLGVKIRALRRSVAVIAVIAAAGCAVEQVAPPEPSLKPQARPVKVALPAPVVAQPTSKRSAMLRHYLHDVQDTQRTQGLLREDGGGPDTPFTAEMLARNFEQIAFFNEYDGNFTGRGGASPLRRWTAPVRMEIIFGENVQPSQKASDTADIRAYVARLARVTGHPISLSGPPNFIVIVASEDNRVEALADAATRVPGITADSLRAMANMRRDTYCAVAAYAAGPQANTYTAAVAVIRAENPDLLRLSCVHEELAQGLGLANDSPGARPSIFNDDDEFALLTRHDELLLKMLYDPRLKIGMSAAQAMPIVRTIAAELTGGPV